MCQPRGGVRPVSDILVGMTARFYAFVTFARGPDGREKTQKNSILFVHAGLTGRAEKLGIAAAKGDAATPSSLQLLQIK
jgi:hypothetical protein